MRRTVTGFVALGAATLLAQVLGFFVLAVLARRLGPSELGSYSFAINLMSYFAIPANFGITALATRDLARDPTRVRPLLGEIIALQGALCVIPYALLVALAPVLAADETSQTLIPIVGLTFSIEAASLGFVLFGFQRFGVMAVARVAGAVTFAALVVAFVDAGDTTRLAWIHLAGVLATTLVTVVAVLRLAGRPRFGTPLRALLGRFRAGIPFGIAAVMISVYYTVDTLLLGYMRGVEEVGHYAVAYRIPLAVLTFAALWGSVLFPHFSALADRRDEVREQIGYFASLALVASLPMLAGTLVVGEQLIPGLFGDEFAEAGTPFIVLMFAAALVPFSINWGTSSVALGDERHQAYAVTLGAVLNLLANLVVIPEFGMTGAAATTVAAEVVVFAYLIWRIEKLVGGHPPLDWNRIGRAALATAVMVLVLVLAVPGDWTAGSKVAVGVIAFFACAVPLRIVRPDELRALLPGRGEAPVDVAQPEAGS